MWPEEGPAWTTAAGKTSREQPPTALQGPKSVSRRPEWKCLWSAVSYCHPLCHPRPDGTVASEALSVPPGLQVFQRPALIQGEAACAGAAGHRPGSRGSQVAEGLGSQSRHWRLYRKPWKSWGREVTRYVPSFRKSNPMVCLRLISSGAGLEAGAARRVIRFANCL